MLAPIDVMCAAMASAAVVFPCAVHPDDLDVRLRVWIPSGDERIRTDRRGPGARGDGHGLPAGRNGGVRRHDGVLSDGGPMGRIGR